MDDFAKVPAAASRRRLTEIANEAGTAKGTVHMNAHAYTLVYEPFFEQLRDRPINLLEIGLSIGGPELGQPASRSVTDAPSVRMWRDYFRRPGFLASIFRISKHSRLNGSRSTKQIVAMGSGSKRWRPT